MQFDQRGSISNWLLFLLLAFALLGGVYTGSAASPEAVQEIVSRAQANPTATSILKESLSQNPTPSVSQLSKIRSKVEKQLVLDLTKSVTRDADLQSAVSAKAEQNKNAEDAVDRRVTWIMVIALLLSAIVGFFKFYQHGTRF